MFSNTDILNSVMLFLKGYFTNRKTTKMLVFTKGKNWSYLNVPPNTSLQLTENNSKYCEWQHMCVYMYTYEICRKCFITLCEQSRSKTKMPITLKNTANKRVGGHVFKTVSNKHLWKFIFIWALKVILLNVTLIDHRQCLRSGLRRSYHSLCLRLLWVLLLLTNHVRSLFFQRQMMRVLFTCRIFPQKEEMKIILEIMKKLCCSLKNIHFSLGVNFNYCFKYENFIMVINWNMI